MIIEHDFSCTNSILSLIRQVCDIYKEVKKIF